MPNWLFTHDGLNRTPSRLDGIDYATECRYRREGTRFIMECGNKMGLRYDTMATGAVYFHRFYMIQSFKNFPRWVTGAACLFLAGKVEETPKKCRDIIKTANSLLTPPQFEAFGPDPKEEVMIYERILLQTIKFDLQVEHPYPCLLKLGKGLKGDRAKLNKLVQMAWTFINDSLSTTLCLKHRSEVIAVAMLALAAKLNNYDIQAATGSKEKLWWIHFAKTVSEPMVNDIMDMMLELYDGKRKERSAAEQRAASADSSPSVTQSPPVKKRREMGSTSDRPGTKPESKQAPLPSAISTTTMQQVSQSTGLQVENISPAPPPDKQRCKSSDSRPPPPAEPQAPLPQLAPLPQQQAPLPQQQAPLPQQQAPLPQQQAPLPQQQAPLPQQHVPLPQQQAPLPQQKAPLPQQATTMYSAPLPTQTATYGYAQATVPMAIHYAGQSYLQTAQYATQYSTPPPTSFPPPPLPPLTTSQNSMYQIPPGNLSSLQNPPSFGMSPVRPPTHSMAQAMGAPPPPLPPMQPRAPRMDYNWSGQYPPNMRGGWMPR
ncbi:cyclin-K-like [Nematostella vectensis]|uniref:cyclin-K-like n=1 Tax=Nematostella vectensis TaxID=45351 RepID=UPI0020775D15|nr:cyclin-K-like [Nematostella vectensis]